jgi:hypothetical protein
MLYLLSSLLVYIFIAGVQNFYRRGLKNRIAAAADFSGGLLISFIILLGMVH